MPWREASRPERRSSACAATSSRTQPRSEIGRPSSGWVPTQEPCAPRPQCRASQGAGLLLSGLCAWKAELLSVGRSCLELSEVGLGERGSECMGRTPGPRGSSPGPWKGGWRRPDPEPRPVFRLSFSDSESDNSADSCLPGREPPPSKKPPPPNSKVRGWPGWPTREEEKGVSWVIGLCLSPHILDLGLRDGRWPAPGLWFSKTLRLRLDSPPPPPRPQRGICSPGRAGPEPSRPQWPWRGGRASCGWEEGRRRELRADPGLSCRHPAGGARSPAASLRRSSRGAPMTRWRAGTGQVGVGRTPGPHSWMRFSHRVPCPAFLFPGAVSQGGWAYGQDGASCRRGLRAAG